MNSEETRFQPGNEAALRHGVTAERQIRPLAYNHRRRVLRQFGLRAGDLSPIGKAYIDMVVRLRAKLDLIDAYVSEQGLIRPDGSPQPVLALYTTLENSLRLAVGKLEAHLGTREANPAEALAEAGRKVREERLQVVG